MFYVEIDYIEEQIQDSDVATVEKSLKDKHEELFVELIQKDLTLVALILPNIYTKFLLLFKC